MHDLLISPREVLEAAFAARDQVCAEMVTESRIEAAQLRFLAPALGGLYPALVRGDYPEFTFRYIKPALAQFVRYLLLTHLAVRVGNDGVVRVKTTDAIAVDAGEMGRLRQEARRSGRVLLDQALGYLREQAGDFPEFEVDAGMPTAVRVCGGVVL